jgi:hypothetical protein
LNKVEVSADFSMGVHEVCIEESDVGARRRLIHCPVIARTGVIFD